MTALGLVMVSLAALATSVLDIGGSNLYVGNQQSYATPRPTPSVVATQGPFAVYVPPSPAAKATPTAAGTPAPAPAPPAPPPAGGGSPHHH